MVCKVSENSEKILRKANVVKWGVYETGWKSYETLQTSPYGQNRHSGATIPSITLSVHSPTKALSQFGLSQNANSIRVLKSMRTTTEKVLTAKNKGRNKGIRSGRPANLGFTRFFLSGRGREASTVRWGFVLAVFIMFLAAENFCCCSTTVCTG